MLLTVHNILQFNTVRSNDKMNNLILNVLFNVSVYSNLFDVITNIVANTEFHTLKMYYENSTIDITSGIINNLPNETPYHITDMRQFSVRRADDETKFNRFLLYILHSSSQITDSIKRGKQYWPTKSYEKIVFLFVQNDVNENNKYLVEPFKKYSELGNANTVLIFLKPNNFLSFYTFLPIYDRKNIPFLVINLNEPVKNVNYKKMFDNFFEKSFIFVKIYLKPDMIDGENDNIFPQNSGEFIESTQLFGSELYMLNLLRNYIGYPCICYTNYFDDKRKRYFIQKRTERFIYDELTNFYIEAGPEDMSEMSILFHDQ